MASRDITTLRTDEALIAERYLARYSIADSETWFSLRLGFGMATVAGISETERKVSAALTRKRVDVFRFGAGFAQIIEIKPRAGLSAAGQLLGYAELFIDYLRQPIEYARVLGANDEDIVVLERCRRLLSLSDSIRNVTTLQEFRMLFPGVLDLIAVSERTAADIPLVMRNNAISVVEV